MQYFVKYFGKEVCTCIYYTSKHFLSTERRDLGNFLRLSATLCVPHVSVYYLSCGYSCFKCMLSFFSLRDEILPYIFTELEVLIIYRVPLLLFMWNIKGQKNYLVKTNTERRIYMYMYTLKTKHVKQKALCKSTFERFVYFLLSLWRNRKSNSRYSSL